MNATLKTLKQLTDSFDRNKDILYASLQKSGLPSAWLGSWERKLAKLLTKLDIESNEDPMCADCGYKLSCKYCGKPYI